jgi:DNA-binding NtrC family response regulator
MSGEGTTMDEATPGSMPPSRVAGAAIVHTGVEPIFRLLKAEAGVVRIGREILGVEPVDDRMSRLHAEIVFGDSVIVRDLGSRNGTFVDGEQIVGTRKVSAAAVLRAGKTLFLLDPEGRRFPSAGLPEVEGVVLGSLSRHARERVRRAASTSDVLLVSGEPGVGKEQLARVFHAAFAERGGDPGPFVAVNCASLPDAAAERMLFGHGDTPGYVEAANGGVLFLDEAAELSLHLQGRLLRLLETHQVLRDGELTPRSVAVRLVLASYRDLRAACARRTFRPELYYRMAAAEVHVPPLRERREEMASLIVRELRRVAPGTEADALFVERCLLRAWPGNVRELLGAVRSAAQAVTGGRLRGEHLDARAGRPFEPALHASPPSMPSMPVVARDSVSGLLPPTPSSGHIPIAAMAPQSGSMPAAPPSASERQRIEAALAKCGGNQTAAARVLGMSRRTLIRRLEAFQLARPRKPSDSGPDLGQP